MLNAGFVRDEACRVFALSDALVSENGAAICDAFLAVAQACGIAQIARDASVSEDALYAALANPAKPDTQLLRQVVTSMVRLLPNYELRESD